MFLHVCPKINFLSKKLISLGLMEKTKQLYVLLALAKCYSATTSFDLWMSKKAYDVFALIINVLGNDQGSPNM
jgi:hypothetical protein